MIHKHVTYHVVLLTKENRQKIEIAKEAKEHWQKKNFSKKILPKKAKQKAIKRAKLMK